MRFKASLYGLALILLSAVQVCPQSISLDHVDGLVGNSALGVGQDITFHIRFSNPSDTAFGGLTNGFRVYSTDSATWLSTILDTTGALGQEQFDLGIFLPTFGVNGQSADTVGFGALRISSSGMPSGFDGIALTIGIGPIAPSNIGKTICLDSSYFPPSGVWKWAAPGAIDVFPTWDGPHCYAIGESAPPPTIDCPPEPLLAEPIANVLANLGAERVMVVHAVDGLDEISTTSETRVSQFDGGQVTTTTITPEEFGIARASMGDLLVDSPEASAEVIRGVLAGQGGPARDIVLLNAAAGLFVAEKADDMKAGLTMAAESVDSGAAAGALEKLIAATAEGSPE